MDSTQVLAIRNLKTYFYTSRGTVKAVDGVNLTVGKGQAVGIVGESGSGKTATALSVMRLIPPPGRIVSGEIIFNGRDLVTLSQTEMGSVRGKDITMVFQDPMSYLNPVMRVGDQIAEAIAFHGRLGKESVRTETLKALSDVGIPAPPRIYNSYAHELSGGMRQRVLIAMAIWCNPTLLILDEPTTALDVTIQAQILELLKRIKSEKQLSLLLITHDLGIAAEICDKIYVMYAGKVAEGADIFELYDSPKHPYTQQLLSSVLSIDEFKEKLVVLSGSVPNMMDPPTGCRFHPRCPYMMRVCSQTEPPRTRINQSHEVFCWLSEK